MYDYSYYRINFTLKVTNSKGKTLSFTTKEKKMKCEMEKFEEKLSRCREPRDSSFSSFQKYLICCKSLLITGSAFSSP